MIKLTERLQSIADEINKGETMADIGTDHGFLPIYLWENGISPHVILSDISAGSLKKAEDNCRRLYPDKNFDLRLGGGLQVLEENETDAVAIAGMGGILMTQILGDSMGVALSCKKIILQPRNQIGFLRHWLYHNGFSVANEKLAREGKRICEIITVVPKEKAVSRGMSSDRVEYQFPHTLLEYRDPLLEEYLQMNLKKEERILSAKKLAEVQNWKAIKNQQYRIDYIRYLIKCLEV